MSSIYTRTFWKDAAERAISTIAQTGISVLTVGSIAGILDVAWIPLASAVALAGLLSLLKSIVAATQGNGSAGLTDATVPADKVIVQETRSGLAVAGPAYVEDEHGDDIPEGTPVDVAPIEPTEEGEPTPGDVDADEAHEDLPMPDGFNEGGYTAEGRRYLDADGDGTPDRLN